MKKQILTYVFSLIFLQIVSAQQYKIDTIQYAGVNNNIINLVIMGDGYTAEEIIYFQEDAKRFTDHFFKTEPFNHYSKYFNVFLINTISEESGATHPCTASDCPKVHHNEESLPLRFNKYPTRLAVPESSPNTIFGSSFDNGGIHRLVVPQKNNVIEEILNNHIPNYTQVVILVNSPFYGGSGGKYATATVNFDSNEIAVHEIGHSFANLADEYWAGNQYAYEGPNRSQEADPKKVSWKNWIGTNGIGVFAYGAKDSKAQWFRPHEFCKMQYLVAPFCNVCQEMFIETIHHKTNPIYKISPNSDTIIDAKTIDKFAVKLLKPSPNTLSVKWFLNNKLLTTNMDSIYINKGILQLGINTLKVEVIDTTALVRNESHQNHTYLKEWKINSEKNYDLDIALSTWGDTLESCFNGYQALSVKKIQVGITYKWFDSEKSKKPVAIGTNLITPKLNKNKTYYLSATYDKKKTDKKPIHIKVLPEILKPENIKIAIEDDKYKISLEEDILKTYNINWYSTKDKAFPRRRNRATLEILKDEVPNKIYLELIDKKTTCKSQKFEVKLK